jgi:hypothetical protein
MAYQERTGGADGDVMTSYDRTPTNNTPTNKTAKDFLERERSAAEKQKCRDILNEQNSHENPNELRKEIERQIGLEKYTGYKSSNLERLIDEYRTSLMQGIGSNLSEFYETKLNDLNSHNLENVFPEDYNIRDGFNLHNYDQILDEAETELGIHDLFSIQGYTGPPDVPIEQPLIDPIDIALFAFSMLKIGQIAKFGFRTIRSKWGVDPAMRAADEAAGVIVKGRYIKNPTANNLSSLITDTGKIGGKRVSGQYMYVVDDTGNIVIGTRAGQKMPHPTLVGGANPQVRAAGIVDIRGGRIYSI